MNPNNRSMKDIYEVIEVFEVSLYHLIHLIMKMVCFLPRVCHTNSACLLIRQFFK